MWRYSKWKEGYWGCLIEREFLAWLRLLPRRAPEPAGASHTYFEGERASDWSRVRRLSLLALRGLSCLRVFSTCRRSSSISWNLYASPVPAQASSGLFQQGPPDHKSPAACWPTIPATAYSWECLQRPAISAHAGSGWKIESSGWVWPRSFRTVSPQLITNPFGKFYCRPTCAPLTLPKTYRWATSQSWLLWHWG